MTFKKFNRLSIIDVAEKKQLTQEKASSLLNYQQDKFVFYGRTVGRKKKNH